MKYKIICVIGARPQFIKHFSLEKAAEGIWDLVSVHTGQHYDDNMSQVFFDQLGMAKPTYQLSLGGGSHGKQTGSMMMALEEIFTDESPDAVVVYGDTNSTLAGALVASKLHIPLVHIEAGLRSYNRKMPEEINRVLTDHISDILFTPSQKSVDNLDKEGITTGVHVIGDIMKDLVKYCVDKEYLTKPNYQSYQYVTLHRPYNVDDEKRLRYVIESLAAMSDNIVFAIHPRTRKKIADFRIDVSKFSNITIIDPQPYFENLSLLKNAKGLITDSGGMQKEAYWLEVPCITIRTETEWEETLYDDANVLRYDDLSDLEVLTKRNKPLFLKELYGDGASSVHIVDKVVQYLSERSSDS